MLGEPFALRDGPGFFLSPLIAFGNVHGSGPPRAHRATATRLSFGLSAHRLVMAAATSRTVMRRGICTGRIERTARAYPVSNPSDQSFLQPTTVFHSAQVVLFTFWDGPCADIGVGAYDHTAVIEIRTRTAIAIIFLIRLPLPLMVLVPNS